jgi:hypothetical protein
MKSFGCFLLRLRQLLQQDIRCGGFFEAQEHNFCSIFELDYGRERSLAYLAGELFEVVCFDSLEDIFFDFIVDPIFQAIQMNDSTRSFAVARIDEGIFFSGLIGEANFTGTFELLFEMEDILFGSVSFLEIEGLSFFGVIDFQDH